MNEDKNIEIRIEENKWECHACGKIGKGFKQIWLAFLCQHFISLCPECEVEFKQTLEESRR